jgi:hypothetical protein
VISAVALTACAALAFRCARRIALEGEAPPSNHASLTAFRMGAAIFGLAFAAPSSFDYRLAFLILILPQVFVWVKAGGRWGRISTVALIAVLCAFWGYRGPWTRFGLDELINWGLFTYCATALIVTLPGFVRWHETCLGSARS